jgi:methionyl-tRNA formyltransferase
MKILFAGTPETAASVLRGLVASGHEVVAVLTREDAFVGRKKILTPSSVAQVAGELGLAVIKANVINAQVQQQLNETGAELGIIVAYGVILKKAILDLLSQGWFNLHYSLLPKYRGAAPVQRAIEFGESETGITLFKLDEGMDTGPILGSLPVVIEENETSGDLLKRLTSLGITLLNQELPKLYSESFSLTEQVGEASYAKKPSRADAKIDFSKSAKDISNLVRAFNPEPVAWCLYKDEPFRILSARVVDVITGPNIGAVNSIDDRIVVTCGIGTGLELLEVQPSSKRAMSSQDWYRGSDHQEVLK